jgi:hypothetical protein
MVLMTKIRPSLQRTESLDNADLSIVELKKDKPHCKIHGAMNAVSVYEEYGKRFMVWRCVTSYKFKCEDLHLPIEQRRFDENPCRAGCVTEIEL